MKSRKMSFAHLDTRSELEKLVFEMSERCAGSVEDIETWNTLKLLMSHYVR